MVIDELKNVLLDYVKDFKLNLFFLVCEIVFDDE